MLPKVFSIIFIFTSLAVSQNDYESMLNSDKEKYSKSIRLSKMLYPGDSKIDITYYGLKLKVTSDPDYLSGSAIIGIRADTTEINDCFLDLKNGLLVDSVLLNGTSAAFTHLNHKVNITLDRIYLFNETFFVEVFYRGVPNSTGFGSFEFDTHNGAPVIWTLSEPYGAPDWFPCKDTPSDKADSSDTWITVAENLTAVSNGTLESVINNGDGTKTFHWKNHNTIGHYLISLAISNYYQYNTYFHYSENDSMVITHFVYPENFNTVKNILDETDNMIEVFSSRYGMYPFVSEKYGHAQTNQGGGMEHQTCTSLGLSSFNPRTVSHELAHQWYGDMITCKDWHHVWLNEGFATYSAAVYIEAKDGKAAYDTYMVSEMELAKEAQGTIWVEDITDLNEIFNWNRSYKKAGTVLHMLRGVTGDSTFFDIMRAYSDDPGLKWGVAATEDFQEVAGNVYGQDLDYFFQEWIYGENYPTYTIEWSKYPAGGDIYHIVLNIDQTANTNPVFFTMPVQVKFNSALGDTIVTLFNNALVQTFQFNIIGEPTSVEFDPENRILKLLLGITEIPVGLTSFSATAKGNEIIINWSTETELNNRGFEIQRSIEGVEFFTVGFVKGHGTTTEQQNYNYADKNLNNGKYYYRLKQIDYNGSCEYSDVVEVELGAFNSYLLEQNYPNPFNPTTTIGFGLQNKSNVKITVLNVIGEEVAVILNEEKDAGYHQVEFNAVNLPGGVSAGGGYASGVYFYQIKAGSFINTRKMILLK